MNIESLDIGLEVRELVEEVLPFTEIVLISPVVQPAVHLSGVEAVLKSDAFERRSELAVVLRSFIIWNKSVAFIYLSCLAIIIIFNPTVMAVGLSLVMTNSTFLILCIKIYL